MAQEELHFIGNFLHISLSGNSMSQQMVISQIILIFLVVFHKALYLDLFFFSYTPLTFLMLISFYHFIFLLMIPIFMYLYKK